MIAGVFTLNPSEIVKWLKERKETLGYSNKKISELTNVPIGTIDRILAGKYTEFKYSSIQPILSVLIGYEEQTPKPKTTSAHTTNTLSSLTDTSNAPSQLQSNTNSSNINPMAP